MVYGFELTASSPDFGVERFETAEKTFSSERIRQRAEEFDAPLFKSSMRNLISGWLEARAERA